MDMPLEKPHRCKFLTHEELKAYWPEWKKGDTQEMLFVPVTIVRNEVLDMTLFYDVGFTGTLYVAWKKVTDSEYKLKMLKANPDRITATVDLEFMRVTIIGIVNKANPEESKVRVYRLSPCE
jgi:hypothetical protein